MMRRQIIAASLLGLASSFACAEEYMRPDRPQGSPAEEAVRKVVEQHIAGIVTGDPEKIEGVWDMEAGSVTSVVRGKDGKESVATGPVADSISLWTKVSETPAEGEIVSIDVAGDRMAFVKAKLTWNGHKFDDYFVLLAAGGAWKLVSKTYMPEKSKAIGGYSVIR